MQHCWSTSFALPIVKWQRWHANQLSTTQAQPALKRGIMQCPARWEVQKLCPARVFNNELQLNISTHALLGFWTSKQYLRAANATLLPPPNSDGFFPEHCGMMGPMWHLHVFVISPEHWKNQLESSANELQLNINDRQSQRCTWLLQWSQADRKTMMSAMVVATLKCKHSVNHV